MKKLWGILLIVGLLFGCSNETPSDQSNENKDNGVQENQQKEVTVTISKNNGEEIIEEKEITISSDKEVTVMDIMEENFEIETQFDGAFISTINGVAASEEEKTSWFYSVNGEDAMVGAKEYKVKASDKIQFDLHSWE